MAGLSDLVGMAGSAVAGAGAASSAADQKAGLQKFDPVKLKLGGVDQGQTQFLSQGAALPDVAALLAKANDQDNAAYQARILAENPSLAGSIAALSKKAADYSQGIIAPDVQRKLDRDSAYQALQGGFGGDSNFKTANDTVNTDKYRLNEQAVLAPQLNQQAFQYSAALNPTNSDVAQTLLSPAALLQRQDQQDTYNNQIANQQAQLNAQADAAKGNILFGENTGGGTSTGIGGL